MTDNSRLCCARFKSRASAVNKGFWQRILGHTLSVLFTLLSLFSSHHLFFTLSIRCSLSLGIANTSAGGRITDKSPGVLDSATLARAWYILACHSRCHIGLKHQRRKAARFKQKPEEPAGPSSTVHIHVLNCSVFSCLGLFLCFSLWLHWCTSNSIKAQFKCIIIFGELEVKSRQIKGNNKVKGKGSGEKARKKYCQWYLRKVSVASVPPCPWSHSPTASLPIKALIKTDKVSPNEERAVGGLNCGSLSIKLPKEIGEGRAMTCKAGGTDE